MIVLSNCLVDQVLLRALFIYKEAFESELLSSIIGDARLLLKKLVVCVWREIFMFDTLSRDYLLINQILEVVIIGIGLLIRFTKHFRGDLIVQSILTWRRELVHRIHISVQFRAIFLPTFRKTCHCRCRHVMLTELLVGHVTTLRVVVLRLS